MSGYGRDDNYDNQQGGGYGGGRQQQGGYDDQQGGGYGGGRQQQGGYDDQQGGGYGGGRQQQQQYGGGGYDDQQGSGYGGGGQQGGYNDQQGGGYGEQRHPGGGNIPQGGNYGGGGGYGGGNDDLTGAAQHAQQHAGGSGDAGIFSEVSSFLGQNKQNIGQQGMNQQGESPGGARNSKTLFEPNLEQRPSMLISSSLAEEAIRTSRRTQMEWERLQRCKLLRCSVVVEVVTLNLGILRTPSSGWQWDRRVSYLISNPLKAMWHLARISNQPCNRLGKWP